MTVSDLAALEADAHTAPSDNVAVDLDGTALRVLPMRKWRSSAVRALRSGDFDLWAEKCLADDGWTLWQAIDPTMEDVETFFADWSKATGQSVGNSSASPRS